MAARQRKTLVACHDCHVAIHAGVPRGARRGLRHGRAGCPEQARPARREAVGKGSRSRDLAGGSTNQNLVEALERCLLRFRPALKVAAGEGDSILGTAQFE